VIKMFKKFLLILVIYIPGDSSFSRDVRLEQFDFSPFPHQSMYLYSNELPTNLDSDIWLVFK
jgi:hypothetical protein